MTHCNDICLTLYSASEGLYAQEREKNQVSSMDDIHPIHYFFSKVGLVPQIIVMIPKYSYAFRAKYSIGTRPRQLAI